MHFETWFLIGPPRQARIGLLWVVLVDCLAWTAKLDMRPAWVFRHPQLRRVRPKRLTCLFLGGQQPSKVDRLHGFSRSLASRPMVAAVVPCEWGSYLMDSDEYRQPCMDAQDLEEDDNPMNYYLPDVVSISATWLLLIGCCWLTLCSLLDGMSDTITYSLSAAFLDLEVLIWNFAEELTKKSWWFLKGRPSHSGGWCVSEQQK